MGEEHEFEEKRLKQWIILWRLNKGRRMRVVTKRRNERFLVKKFYLRDSWTSNGYRDSLLGDEAAET
jgi:hypothetical protein